MNRVVALVATVPFLLVGCTSVQVRPVAPDTRITSVLIQENPKVWDADFLSTLVDGFNRHGIATRVVQPTVEVGDAYVVTYVAFQRWDIGMYLSDATIRIQRNNQQIAEATYHLKGGGGLALTKWQGTRTKLDPVIDELLANVNAGAPPVQASGANIPASTAITSAASGPEARSVTVDSACEFPSPVERAECLGRIKLGMTKDEVVRELGRPNETRAVGESDVLLRYCETYLTFDQAAHLTGISDRPPQ